MMTLLTLERLYRKQRPPDFVPMHPTLLLAGLVVSAGQSATGWQSMAENTLSLCPGAQRQLGRWKVWETNSALPGST